MIYDEFTPIIKQLDDVIEKIEEKIEACKNFQFNTINKIKNTIANYGSKLARLELMDISEKSGIQDENLIEKIIIEMIKKQEYLQIPANIYFWRTYDRKEIDFIEERGGWLYGYEIKWKDKKTKPPLEWLHTYKKAKYNTITRENYLDYNSN